MSPHEASTCKQFTSKEKQQQQQPQPPKKTKTQPHKQKNCADHSYYLFYLKSSYLHHTSTVYVVTYVLLYKHQGYFVYIRKYSPNTA